MFYWCRLAYRDDEQLDYKHVNIQHAMELFGLDQVCAGAASLSEVLGCLIA